MYQERQRGKRVPERVRIAIATVLAVLLGVAVYWGATVGLARLNASEPVTEAGPGSVPHTLYAPEATVPTTANRGPVGPVSVVFAVPEVKTGLFGTLEHPWVEVSSQTGDYRAISAPHLPAAGRDAVAVSPDGRLLAWAHADGIVLYDTVRDDARELQPGFDGTPVVGTFSADGGLLTVYDGQLEVLDTESGDIAATLPDVDEEVARQAVWTPDGEALTFVESGQLIRLAWETGKERRTPAPGLDARATLAWDQDGGRLAVTRRVPGTRVVDVYKVRPSGQLSNPVTVRPPGYSQQQLFGFAPQQTVAVSALSLETGPLETVLAMSTLANSTPPGTLVRLPGDGINRASLEIATTPLANGGADFAEPDWPLPSVSKLVLTLLLVVFLVGMYVFRRRRAS